MNKLAAVMNPMAAMALSASSNKPPEAPVRVGKSGIILLKFPFRVFVSNQRSADGWLQAAKTNSK
jgi:hypothetical protein